MLILARALEQEILVGDDVRIKVIDMRDGRVWLGITAPREVSIDRLEVRDRKLRDGVRYRPPQRLTWEDLDNAD